MDKKQLLEAISKLNEFDFDNFSQNRYKTYRSLFNDVFASENLYPILYFPIENIVFSRARINNDKYIFKSVKDLWYPPKEKATAGRFNKKNEPMFYATHNIATAILEVNPQKGDIVTVLNFKIKQQYVNSLFLSWKYYAEELMKLLNEKDIIRLEYIIGQSRKIISSERKELYTPTQVFASSFRLPELECFIYESISTEFNSLNFAFKPEFIDQENIFEFSSVITYEIISNYEDYKYDVRCRIEAIDLDDFNKFNWRVVKCKGHQIKIDNMIHQREEYAHNKS